MLWSVPGCFYLFCDRQIMNLPLYLYRFIQLGKIATGLLLCGLILTVYTRYAADEYIHNQSKIDGVELSAHLPSSISEPAENAIDLEDKLNGSSPIALQQIAEIVRLNGMDDLLTIKQLTSLLRQGDDAVVRQRAVLALAETGRPEAIDGLIYGLADRHELVREITLRELLIAQYQDIDLILGQALYGDRSLRVRLLAIELLSGRNNPSAEIFLLAASRGQHPELRVMAEQALGLR